MDNSTPKRPTDRREILLLTLLTLFIGFFVTAELLGAKLFHFTLFGLSPASLGLGKDEVFVATTGILAFPLTFILTDVINEFFGKRIVRQFTFLALGVNAILQLVVQAAIRVPASSFTEGVSAEQVQSAYSLALGQGGRELTYTYDAAGGRVGIVDLLKSLADAGIAFKDLHTTESSLEEIFVGLVSERSTTS